MGDRDLHRSANFLAAYLAVTAATIVIVIISVFEHMNIAVTNGLYCLLLSLCIYGLAYANWKHAAPIHELGTTLTSIPEMPSTPKTSPRIGGRRVDHLSDEQFGTVRERMVKVLELEQAYLDDDLSLGVVSQRMQVPIYQVSEAINRHYACSFFDAVNRMRVEEVKRRLIDPEHARLSILGIAMDAGFSSKSSFNQAFRKHTGTTPSAFRKT